MKKLIKWAELKYSQIIRFFIPPIVAKNPTELLIEDQCENSLEENKSRIIKVLDENDRLIRSSAIAVISFAIFSLVSLAQPDHYMVSGGGIIKIPFANVNVSFPIFMLLGPSVFLILVIYLHLFLQYRFRSNFDLPVKERLPFVFNHMTAYTELLSVIFFYMIPIVVFWAYVIKALPIYWSNYMIPVALTLTSVIIILGIRRTPLALRTFIALPVTIATLVFMIVLIIDYVTPISKPSTLALSAKHDELYSPCTLPKKILWRRLELSGQNLKNASFKYSNLAYANLLGANIDGGRLQNLILDCINAEGASFKGTSFDKSRLFRAHLNLANLQGASFVQANLQGAKLVYVNAQDSTFMDANLSGSNFVSSNIMGADFSRANISNANFTKANLRGANFQSCKAKNANFSGYDGNLVPFKGCDLRDASFPHLQIEFVNLGIYSTNITAAISDIDRKTEWIVPIPCEGPASQCEEVAPHWKPAFNYNKKFYRIERLDDRTIASLCKPSLVEQTDPGDDIKVYLVRQKNAGKQLQLPSGKTKVVDFINRGSRSYPASFIKFICKQ